MNNPFTCPTCRDEQGRPIVLACESTRHIRGAITRRYRRCPRCRAKLMTDERVRSEPTTTSKTKL